MMWRETSARLMPVSWHVIDTPSFLKIHPMTWRGTCIRPYPKDYYHAAVSDTLIITMKGIAAGMQNTG
jgi:hypothetical protein